MAGRISRATTRRNASNKPRARNLPHLASRLFGTPLLVDERKLDAIVPAFLRRINGEADVEPDEDDAREPAEMMIDPQVGIAVIPVIGSIVRRPTWLDAWSGLTSYEEIGESLEAALNDARVKGILFQIDSFGGEAPGCFELCDKIYAARSKKPIWGIADVDAMSAGYAILSSCEQCYGTARGTVGSIGVISVHVERSQQNAMMGVTYTVFRAGARKGDFNPYEKLSAEAGTKLMASIERTRQTFVETVSRNRPGVAVQTALDTEGQWFDPEDALTLGLIDGISTYDDVYASLIANIVSPAPAEAAEAPDDAEPPIEASDDDDDDIAPAEPDELPIVSTEVQPMATDATGKPPQSAASVPTTPAAPAAPVAPALSPEASAAALAATTADVISLDSVRQPAEARAVEIASLCKMAGFSAEAPDLIAGGLSVEDVRKKLTDMRAAASDANVSGHHSGGQGNGGVPGFAGMRPDPAALASWEPHFKAAQAANPKFREAATRGLIPQR